MKLAYRREIDGLRAIAVLAVVLYHAGIGGAGFVGVDVFFVISGYLITSLLLAEHGANGRIDLLAFYARRVRRIVPAATLVVLATVAMAWPLLGPDQFAHLGRSAAAALLFVANFFFQYASGGYFDRDASTMPLLHLWSLSVEEQFYLLWPALLVFSRSRRMIVVLAALSLLLAIALEATHPQAAFYQMPARFWELAAGGFIAATPVRGGGSRAAGALGIVLVLASAAWSVGGVHLANVAPAVAGAALVLWSLHHGAGNRLLASRPMVGVGLVSYSLYLWHWPLLALYRANALGDGDLRSRLLLCGLALLLAIVSWRYVEQPFRRLRTRKGATVAVAAATSASLACLVYGLAWSALQPDFRDRFPEATFAGRDQPYRVLPGPDCHEQRDAPGRLKCGQPSRTVVWGDSMAYAWLPAFPGATVATRDACPPLVGFVPEGDKPWRFACRDFNEQVSRLDADTFVIASWWIAHPGFDLRPSLERLRGKRVLVLGPTPWLPRDAPDCMRARRLAACTITRAGFDAQARPILAQLRAQAAGFPGVEVIDLSEQFCTRTECPPVLRGVALYWDSHHVSATAARNSGLKARLAANGASP
jgi:peptidoglycan/LPS O-acetylase OafA/YrhL